jgi:transposase InsO family protein
MCSDNSSKFIVKHLQIWFRKVGIEPIQILKRLPWENGYLERIDGKFLNAEWFNPSIKRKPHALPGSGRATV